MNEHTAVVKAGTSFASVSMDQAGGGGMLAPKSLGEVVAFAQVMSRADLALPRHLRGNDGACMAVAMQAMRWEMDPFAVANKSYSVNDRLAYEAQLIAAVVHTRAPILGRPAYSYSGEGPTRRCTVTCVMADGEERLYESPTFGQITTKNSPLWKTDPDQQLGYYAIRSWARRHAPETILGVYTPDEVADFRDHGAREAPPALTDRLKAQAADRPGFSPGHIDAEFAAAGEVFAERAEAVAETVIAPEPATFDPEEVAAGADGVTMDAPGVAQADLSTLGLKTGADLQAEQAASGALAKEMGAEVRAALDKTTKALEAAETEDEAKAVWHGSAKFRGQLGEHFPEASDALGERFNAVIERLAQ